MALAWKQVLANKFNKRGSQEGHWEVRKAIVLMNPGNAGGGKGLG